MANVYADYVARMNALVKDGEDAVLASEALFLDSARIEYSQRKPDYVTVELTGDGNAYFTLPGAFIEGFSDIFAIEYPLENVPPTYLEPKQYFIQKTPTGDRVTFVDSYPGNGVLFWFTYTVLRELNDGGTITILKGDFEGFSYLAASIKAQALAEHYSGVTSPTLIQDTTSYINKGRMFSDRAKELRKLYDKTIPVTASGKFANWNTRLQTYGRYLTHGIFIPR